MNFHLNYYYVILFTRIVCLLTKLYLHHSSSLAPTSASSLHYLALFLGGSIAPHLRQLAAVIKHTVDLELARDLPLPASASSPCLSTVMGLTLPSSMAGYDT